jgi:hypothetical protein
MKFIVEFKSFYKVDDIQLQGLWLSKHGVTEKGFGFCEPCLSSLKHGKMPLWAIADGNQLPDPPSLFSDLNGKEKQMVARIHTMNYIGTCKGGTHSCIKSHCYFVECTNGTVASALPRTTNF